MTQPTAHQHHVTPRELNAEMMRLSNLLDVRHQELIDVSHRWATSEDTYRLAKANAYLAATGTVQERQARVDKATSVERKEAHLAESLKKAAEFAIRNAQIQLSALQTVANAVRSEVEMAGRR